MVRSFNIISRKKSSSGSQRGEALCVSEKIKAVLHLLRRKGPPLSAKQLDYCNEACIGRLLKAKGNHVKKAAKQLRATLAWRASLDIDYLTADEFSAELAWGNAYVAGQDEEGRPVLVVKLKPEIVSGQAQKQFIRYFVFTVEVALACMPSSVEQCILILDAAACHKRGPPAFSTVVQLLKVLGEHYPERLARCFIVDAPAMFYFLWKGISQVLDLKVREKPRFVFSKKYISEGVQKVNSSASAAANHLMRAARSYSSRNLWAGEDQLSDEEEELQDNDKFELRTPSISRTIRTRPPLAVSCNSPPVICTSSSSFPLYSLSSLSPSSLSPSSTSLSSSSSTSFSPSSTSLLSSSLWISAASSSSVSSSTSASLSSSLTTSSLSSSLTTSSLSSSLTTSSLSSSTSSSCSLSSSSSSSTYPPSTSSSFSHSNNGAALLSDKVHARSLSFASVPTCRKEAVSEFRSFRADTKPSRRLNEDGVSRRWADLTFGPRNDELLPHHHQHIDYARKHKSATLFRPYYTNFLISPYNEAAYRGRMKPPLAGLISIISPDLKYRQPSFSLHSTAMEAMLQHLHFD